MAQTFRRTQFCGPQAFKTGDLWDLLFDGTNIWISHQGEDTVVQMDRSGIVVLGMFPTGPSPTQLVFDGATL